MSSPCAEQVRFTTALQVPYILAKVFKREGAFGTEIIVFWTLIVQCCCCRKEEGRKKEGRRREGRKKKEGSEEGRK
jgi:hypothetical protein